MLASDGAPGRVLHVKATDRSGPENFVTCMRKAVCEDTVFRISAVSFAREMKAGVRHLGRYFRKLDMRDETRV